MIISSCTSRKVSFNANASDKGFFIYLFDFHLFLEKPKVQLFLSVFYKTY